MAISSSDIDIRNGITLIGHISSLKSYSKNLVFLLYRSPEIFKSVLFFSFHVQQKYILTCALILICAKSIGHEFH